MGIARTSLGYPAFVIGEIPAHENLPGALPSSDSSASADPAMMRRIRAWLSGPGLGPQVVAALAGSAGVRMAGLGLGFLVGVQLARGLGPAGYGVYGSAMAVLSVLMIPTHLGLPELITREVASALAAGGGGATAVIVKWGRKAILVSSVLIAGALAFAMAFGLLADEPALSSTLMIGALWIPAVAFGKLYGAALRGTDHIALGQLGEFLISPVLVSLLLFLFSTIASSRFDPAAAMWINVFAATVAAVTMMALLKRVGAGKGSTEIPDGLRFSHALPMAGSEGMRVLGGQLGTLILAAMVSKHEVGWYRVALGIYTVTTMPAALVSVACAPIVSRLHTQARTQQLAKLNIYTSVFLIVPAAFFFLVNVLFGREAISLVFGAPYAPASNVLTIFLGGELLASLFGFPTSVLNMMRQQRVVVSWAAVALIINFIVAIALVHELGYTGAAYGSVVSLIVWRAGCGIFAKWRLGMDTAMATLLIPSSGRRRLTDGRT